jgi:hypothetical protein
VRCDFPSCLARPLHSSDLSPQSKHLDWMPAMRHKSGRQGQSCCSTNKISARSNRNLKITHINAVPQMGKILFEQLDDICTCCFPSRNHNTTGGTSSHSNHFFEGWVLKGLNGLHVHTLSVQILGKNQGVHLVSFNQPLDGCISEKLIRVWYHLLSRLFLG